MRTERQYRNNLKTERDHIYFLSIILKMRYARRDEGYSPNFIDRTSLFTARIRYKFITVDIFYIILQFVNRA
jgi:hypothetical protein